MTKHFCDICGALAMDTANAVASEKFILSGTTPNRDIPNGEMVANIHLTCGDLRLNTCVRGDCCARCLLKLVLAIAEKIAPESPVTDIPLVIEPKPPGLEQFTKPGV